MTIFIAVETAEGEMFVNISAECAIEAIKPTIGGCILVGPHTVTHALNVSPRNAAERIEQLLETKHGVPRTLPAPHDGPVRVPRGVRGGSRPVTWPGDVQHPSDAAGPDDV